MLGHPPLDRCPCPAYRPVLTDRYAVIDRMRPVRSPTCAAAQVGTTRLAPTKGETMTASTQPNPGAVLSRLANGGLDGRWTLDPAQSSVHLKTASMWGMAKINCTFTELSGDATVEGATITGAQIVIASGSVATKNSQRDKHLRSKDFLRAAEYPNIVFTLNSIASTGASLTAHGGLTVAGITKPLSVDLVPTDNEDGTITLASELDIDRRDYGLTWNKAGMASTNNTITIAATFSRN
jgi:polyisoprenoid-binding protein YceI